MMVKWAKVTLGGVIQDYMFVPRRSPHRDLLKFILHMEQVVGVHLTAGLLELHGLLLRLCGVDL